MIIGLGSDLIDIRRIEKITPLGMKAQIDLTITDDFPLAQAIVIISAVKDE